MPVRLLALALVLVAPRTALAQTAAGFPSFDEGPFLITVGAAFGDDAMGFGAGFEGGTNDIFGGISVGFTRVGELETTATGFTGVVGSNFPIDARGRVFLSPVGEISFTSGPDVGDIDVNVFGVRGGARLGIVARDRNALAVIPTFGLDLAHDRVSAELAGNAATTGDTYAIVRLGAGFLFDRRFALVPAVSMPVGRAGADVGFAIAAAFLLGR